MVAALIDATWGGYRWTRRCSRRNIEGVRRGRGAAVESCAEAHEAALEIVDAKSDLSLAATGGAAAEGGSNSQEAASKQHGQKGTRRPPLEDDATRRRGESLP